MNNRREDAMIQLAFGELSDAEAQALRASMSDAERKEADLMASLRQDLKAMPVAPHQLSTERLRDAILNEGLHPKPQAAPWWRFAWAPVAVLAVAYLGTRMMGGPATANEPIVAINNPAPAVSSSGADLDFQPTREPLSIPSPSTMAAATEPAPEHPTRAIRRSNRGASRNNASRVIAMATTEAPSAPAAMLANAVITNAAPTDATGMADSAAVRESREEPKPVIVLIDSERDSATGANRAMEVSSASNVVIGG